MITLFLIAIIGIIIWLVGLFIVSLWYNISVIKRKKGIKLKWNMK